MAQFKKGNSLGGRKKGSLGKATSKVKDTIQKILEDNADMIQWDLDQLQSRDRLKFMIDLMGFVVPKMKSVEAKITAVSEMSDNKIAQLERMNELMIEIQAEDITPTEDEEDNKEDKKEE